MSGLGFTHGRTSFPKKHKYIVTCLRNFAIWLRQLCVKNYSYVRIIWSIIGMKNIARSNLIVFIMS
jgi:hypothetical protein